MKLKDTLLLVSSSAKMRSSLREIFADTYNIIEAANHEQALFLFEQNVNCIAAALLDIKPPKTRRSSLTVKMRNVPGSESLPIIILCDGSDASYEIKGYEYGASDVIFKPFNEATIFHRVQTLVELSVHKNNLEVLLEEQASILRSSNESMVDVLSTIIEYRSIETGNHVMRIRQYTEVLLQKVMETYPEYNLTTEDIASIVSAASLHDIGKISIPDSILNKPGKLTDEEFETMKSHTTNGAQILQNLNEFGDHKYLRYAYNICLYHHERWDGSGYPKGLVGDDIPICAQVVGIADVYDALTTDRVYKKAYSHNKALNMILNGECGAFSHKVLECLKRVGVDFRKIKSALDDKNYGNKDDLSVPLPAPSYQLQKVDALQMVQVKYQTLLHHVNATVLEAQLNSGVYHIVFNPNPDFYLPAFKETLDEAINDMVYTVVHPSDRKKVIKQFADCKNILIKRGLRKYSFTFRMYVPSVGDYIPYKTTILHIKEASFENPAIMVVFEPVSTVSAAPAPSEYSKSIQTLNDVAHFHNLVGSTIICENSNAFSILYGSETLFNLVGYTPYEIETLFHNSLMELVFPEDQASLIEQIDAQLKEGKMFELEYRLMRKNGTPVWVLDKSNLIEDEHGKEYFYSFLIDNSNVKNTQARLEEELSRNQLIINQSNDIVFELDVNTDHLWCSDKWEERFGHRALHDNYTENVFQHSHIHPDDMPKMREGIGKLLKGATHVDIDVRIVNSEGIYLWNQIRATSQKDAAGNITKAIGVIVDIDNEIKSIQTLQKKSERDALTGLYNKEALQNRVTALLAGEPSESLSALLIMDLDNFKAVNDTYGHLFGDNILIDTALKIRKYFRNDDIISRIGGDEFAVYVNTFTDKSIITDRCALLQEALNDMYHEMLPDIDVSCSIGIALVPDHGNNFMDLYHKADQALYQAKRAGKNRLVIYDSDDTIVAKALSTTINEHIDSDEQPGVANNSLLYFLFQRLYESENMYTTIQGILEEVGRRLNVSRVYIFETNDEHTELFNTFEWCNKDITAEKDNLQALNYIDGDVAGWPMLFNERGIFYSTDITTLAPNFRAILEPQGIKSMLQCAIYDNGVFSGFIGFDECTLNRHWTQNQIDLLTLLSQTMATFLLKERAREKTERMSSNLINVLNNQDAWVYVIDPDTYKLKYINQRTKAMSSDIIEDELCHKVLMHRDTPCENCPVRNIASRKNSQAIINNKAFGLTVRCRAAEIKWNGQHACLVTCHKLEN